MKVTVEQTWISPEIAVEWLANYNTKNRPISQSHVARLAAEMTAGRWQVNGDTFAFNGNELIDGQHRLAAVVKSGISIPAIIVRDLPSDAFYTKNLGSKVRTSGEVLAIKNIPNYNQVAAATRIVLNYNARADIRSGKVTARQIAEFCDANKGIVNSGQFVRSLNRFPPINYSMLNACHFLFSGKNEEAADQFLHQLCSGEMLIPGSPISLLRNRMISESQSTSKSTVHLSWKFGMIIKAWNLCRSGKTAQVLKFGVKEEMPAIL